MLTPLEKGLLIMMKSKFGDCGKIIGHKTQKKILLATLITDVTQNQK